MFHLILSDAPSSHLPCSFLPCFDRSVKYRDEPCGAANGMPGVHRAHPRRASGQAMMDGCNSNIYSVSQDSLLQAICATACFSACISHFLEPSRKTSPRPPPVCQSVSAWARNNSDTPKHTRTHSRILCRLFRAAYTCVGVGVGALHVQS